MWSILGEVTNTAVVSDDRAWKQASLPMKLGGLGVKSTVEVAPSAYLASLHATSALVKVILPVSLPSFEPSLFDDALSYWSECHDFQPPVGVDALKQKSWDQQRALAAVHQLVEGAVNGIDKSHLLASSTKESGACLQALPISALGLRLDNNSLGIVVGLRLGTPLCVPHQCRHCGEEVDVMGKYGLSCRWSEGRQYRYAAMNNIIHRALISAGVPARRDPPGLLCSDGK